MLSGKKSKDCTVCYKEDENDKNLSLRLLYLTWGRLSSEVDLVDYAKQTKPDGTFNQRAQILHLTLGNACTGQCNMCSPWNSSALHLPHKKISEKLGYDYQYNPDDYKWANDDETWEKKYYPKIHSGLRSLYLVGGEPMIIDRNYKILKYCVDNDFAKNIRLYYSTNTMQMVPEEVQLLWREFKHVHLDLSIDDIHERNEYIRYPSKFEQTLEFVEWCDNETDDNVSIGVGTTIQNLNIYYLPEIQDWWFKQNYKKINKNLGGFVYVHMLNLPERCSPSRLPLKAKELIKTKITNWLCRDLNYQCPSNHPQIIENSKWAQTRIMSLLTHMYDKGISSLDKSDEEHFDDFLKWTTALDGTRNTNYLNVFPVFREFVNG